MSRYSYRVLIIQLTRMGDIIQTIPLIVRLREEIPESHITFLCVDRFAEIIRATPLVNRYIKIRPEEALKLKKLNTNSISSILEHPFLKEPYDLVVNLTHDMASALIANKIKASSKSGAIAEDSSSYLKLKDKWGRYVFACVNNREENSFNLVDIHIGMGKVSHSPVRGYLKAEIRSQAKIEKLLSTISVPPASPLVAFHMGANKPHRTWPVEHFCELAHLLIKHHDACIVLTGSHGEQAIFDEFARGISQNFIEKGRVINLIGSTKLQDLIALLSRCSLLVSNDTGPIHIAAAVGTPTIGIYISTAYPGETAPYGEGHYVVHPTLSCYPCLNELSGFQCGLPCRWAIPPSLVFHIATSVIENRNIQAYNNTEAVILKSSFLSNGTLFYSPIDFSNLPSKMKYSWLDKKFLRVLWEGILGLPSDWQIMSGVSPEEVLRRTLKANAVLEGINELLKTQQLGVKDSSLKNLSGILAEFFMLSVISECYDDIPQAVISMKQKLTELQSWAKTASQFA